MVRLDWSNSEKGNYKTTIDRAVFYPKGGTGCAWSGLITVDEQLVDVDRPYIYVDGVGHLNRLVDDSFKAVISAMTYPLDFEPFIYGSKNRFDLCYREKQIGSNYNIHIVYNALIIPKTKNYYAVNQDSELFIWNLYTKRELVPNARSSSHFVINSLLVNFDILDTIESQLYGTDNCLPRMPTIIELLSIFENASLV